MLDANTSCTDARMSELVQLYGTLISVKCKVFAFNTDDVQMRHAAFFNGLKPREKFEFLLLFALSERSAEIGEQGLFLRGLGIIPEFKGAIIKFRIRSGGSILFLRKVL